MPGWILLYFSIFFHSLQLLPFDKLRQSAGIICVGRYLAAAWDPRGFTAPSTPEVLPGGGDGERPPRASVRPPEPGGYLSAMTIDRGNEQNAPPASTQIVRAVREGGSGTKAAGAAGRRPLPFGATWMAFSGHVGHAGPGGRAENPVRVVHDSAAVAPLLVKHSCRC